MSEIKNIADLFFQTAGRFPDNPFLYVPQETAEIYNQQTRTYSYKQAVDFVTKWRDIFMQMNIGIGTRIGVALENRPEFFLYFIALNSVGASLVPLNVEMQKQELVYIIEHSELEIIITIAPFCERLEKLTQNCSQDISVIIDETMAARVNLLIGTKGETNRQSEAAILYTSGTTGKPKGCLLSNEYFLHIGEFYVSLGGHCQFEEGKERLITPLPVTHMNALACSFMAMIQSGGCLIQLERFHPSTWWDSIVESKATIMHYLGVMPAMLLGDSETKFDNSDGQIKFAFGAGCDPVHHQRFEDRFSIPLIEAWSMTETGAGAWITAQHEPRHVGTRCFGKLPKGLEARIVAEDGTICGVDESGELQVRRAGNNLRQYFFSSYLKNEDATEDAWSDGWFHTGDAVKCDAEGHFYFVDRLKSIIRRSGENISAVEVETVLLRNENIEICVAVPVADDIRGEEVMAIIVLSKNVDDREGLARTLFDQCFAELAYYKAPAYISFVDEIIVTASQKVKRPQAKKQAADLFGRGDFYDFGKLKSRKRIVE